MNAFQVCRNAADAVPLYLPQQLYLKPVAAVCISVQLAAKTAGQTIVHGEIILKLKQLIAPDEFAAIKVTRSAVDVVRFEAELELEAYVQRVLCKLDNKFIKLKDIPQLLKVKACEAKCDFPTRHEWDAFFRDAKDMNEMKFGERPDTVHISNLPTKWFTADKHDHPPSDDALPSEKLLFYAFEKYGDIRQVDIPICDPYRCKMKPHITGIQSSSFDERQFFEGYVQFKEYMGFAECMDALRGKRLMRKDRLGEAQMAKIIVTFDKSKHLSEGAIRRRDILRERLIMKQKSKEDIEKAKQAEVERKQSAEKERNASIQSEKQRRRREREEKRKAKILAQLKGQEKDEFQAKVAKEEKKLLAVQRRLEAIRLVEDLFKRLEGKLESGARHDRHVDSATDNQLKRMRLDVEAEYCSQRDTLAKAVEGRLILRSIVSTTAKEVCSEEASTSGDDSIGNPERDAEKVYPSHPLSAAAGWYPPYWQNQLMAAAAYGAVAPPPFYPNGQAGREYYYMQRGGRGRGGGHPGPSGGRARGRGVRGRSRPYRTSKFSSERCARSRSRSHPRYRDRSWSSRSRSRSRSRTRSRSNSKHARRDRRHRSRARSRSTSRSRSKSRSGSRSRSH